MDRRIEGVGKARARTGGIGAIATAAAAATVAGHELAYRLIYSQPYERAAALAHTGHSYWPGAIRAAVVLAVVGVALQVSRGVVAALSEPPRVRSLAAWLATLQVAFFTSMEMVERAVEHESPAGLLTQRGLWVGVLTQLLLATVVAVVLRAARRAGQVLRALLVEREVLPHARWWQPRESLSFSGGYHGSSWRTRAPPARVAMTR
ncbi:MAG: hypothetical protein M3290_03710 [Actinomycetota bacterium]|nr:hypothetical protein [Actinomycetota bacterium]